MFYLLKEQLKQDGIDIEAILPVLQYVKRENPVRMQEFVRLLAKVKQDLAEQALDDNQLEIKFND